LFGFVRKARTGDFPKPDFTPPPGGGGSSPANSWEPASSFFLQRRDPPPPTDLSLVRRFYQWLMGEGGASQQPFFCRRRLDSLPPGVVKKGPDPGTFSAADLQCLLTALLLAPAFRVGAHRRFAGKEGGWGVPDQVKSVRTYVRLAVRAEYTHNTVPHFPSYQSFFPPNLLPPLITRLGCDPPHGPARALV